MSDSDTTVSICIPIYNGAPFLRACLDSVLAQSRTADEILIVDDGSTDGGPAIVEEYRAREPRIRFVCNPKNLGLVGNWNRCIDLATSTWIKFLFQDDLLEPECLAAMTARIDPSTDLIACGRDFVFEETPTAEVAAFYAASRHLIETIFRKRDRIDAETACKLAIDQFGHNLFGEPSAILVRKTCFERFGRFREGLVMSCDLEYWIRVVVHSGAVYVPETLARFRVHASSTSADNFGRRAFRMWSLDNLLLLRDFAREPVYLPLRRYAAAAEPPFDLEGWLLQRRHEVFAQAIGSDDPELMKELEGFFEAFPDIVVTVATHRVWRAKRKLRGALNSVGDLGRRLDHTLATARASLDHPVWLRRPPSLDGQRVCVLVTWSPDGSVTAHALHLAGAWHAAGFVVVLMIACDVRPESRWDPARDPFIAGAAVRGNIGYDFGSWAAAVRDLPSLAEATLVAFANDSVFGPLRSFGAMLSRVEASTADVIGVTDSHQEVHHLQSYLVFYRPTAVRSAAFARFWNRHFIGGREEIIASAEMALLAHLEAAGLTVEVLFPSAPAPTLNPTLFSWRELIDAGYPFVKIQLLRDNPHDADLIGWASVLERNGVDPTGVERHFGAAFPASAAARAAALS